MIFGYRQQYERFITIAIQGCCYKASHIAGSVDVTTGCELGHIMEFW